MTYNLTQQEKERRDNLVLQGLSFAEIGRREGVSRAAVSRYVQDDPLLHEKWKQLQFKVRQRKKIEQVYSKPKHPPNISKRLEELKQFAQQHGIGPRDFSYLKAEEFYHNRVFSHYSPDQIYGILQNYFRATSRNGEGTSLKKLGAPFGLLESAVREILISVGERSPNGSRYKPLNDLQSNAIYNGLIGTTMGYSDIAFFSEASSTAVLDYAKSLDGEVSCDRELFLADFGCRGRISRRTASLVYEMMHSSKSETTIKRTLGIRKEVFQVIIPHLVENRDSYEPKLVAELSLIFPDRNITRSYKTFSLNENGFNPRRD